MFGMECDADCFGAPIGEAVEGTDAEAAEAGFVGAFGSVEAPIEIALGSGGVDLFVDRAVVSLLIHDEAFGAGFDQRTVLGGFHGADFEGDGGKFVVQRGDAIAEVSGGNEFGMFAGAEEDVAEPRAREFVGFAADFIEAEGDAEDGVIARETAILAVVDAFVGEVKRCEKANDFTETLLREELGTAAEFFEVRRSGFGDEGGKIGESEG